MADKFIIRTVNSTGVHYVQHTCKCIVNWHYCYLAKPVTLKSIHSCEGDAAPKLTNNLHVPRE